MKLEQPRYYQRIAINRAVYAVASGKDREYNVKDFDRTFVLDERTKVIAKSNINSMREFKQIIGRGTRLLED